MIRALTAGHVPVRAQPLLPLDVFLGRENTSAVLPFPLSVEGVVLTYSGTSAIYQAFRALGLNRGDRVLCPSYNCGHELEPLLRLGLSVDCYRVSSDLTVDLEDVEERMRRGARALMVTHYFGFAQPLAQLRAICDRHDALLVEDCAHSFLSDNATHSLGRTGDVAVYSMRKVLPIPNGGAVCFNNPQLRLREDLVRPPSMSTAFKSLNLVTKFVLDRFTDRRSIRDLLWLLLLLPSVLASRAVRKLHPRSSVDCYDPDNEDFAFSNDIMNWSMSPFSGKIFGALDCRAVIAKRRANYRNLVALLDGAAGCRVLLPDLPESTCPLYFPLWVENPLQLRQALSRDRLYTDAFWQNEHPAIKWCQYPEARELKRHVLILPVHQDLDTDQIERLANQLIKAVASP